MLKSERSSRAIHILMMLSLWLAPRVAPAQSAATGQDQQQTAVDDTRLSPNVAKYNAQNPTFNPGTLPKGTNTTWTFKTSTDNAVANLLVSSEGLTGGSSPDGFAQVQINAQDEIRRGSAAPIGSNMSGYLRVMSKTFNNGMCRGTLCPDMVELYSDNDLRFTAAGTGRVSFVKNGSTHFLLDSDGYLKTYTSLFGFGPNGEQAFQIGPLGMEIGGTGPAMFYPPRYPPNDAMSSRRWLGGSMRVASRLAVGCDLNTTFGRLVDNEPGDQAGLCVQPAPNGEENVAAQISTPRRAMATEAIGLQVDATDTSNDARNIGISVIGANLGTGGETSLKIRSIPTSGIDYGVDIETDSERGVEYPLAIRANGADRLLVCGDGGLLVGLDCTKSQGVGTINLARDLYRDGTAYNNPDYVFEHFYTARMLRFGDNPGASSYTGLLPLSDLEKYTQAHFELPRIAQARGLFERQDAALASLEEAYLYIFQLYRQIGELKARLAALEKPR